MGYRKRDSKKEKCFICRKRLLKGNWVWLHDNILNKDNPKTFCSKRCKMLYIDGLINTKTLEKFIERYFNG